MTGWPRGRGAGRTIPLPCPGPSRGQFRLLVIVLVGEHPFFGTEGMFQGFSCKYFVGGTLALDETIFQA